MVDPFTPPDPSQDEIIRGVLVAITANDKLNMDEFIVRFKNSWDLFWSNPTATPQQICDALGPLAVKFFQTAQSTQDFISSIVPDYVQLTPPNLFQINPDGTVTIGDLINPVDPPKPNPTDVLR